MSENFVPILSKGAMRYRTDGELVTMVGSKLPEGSQLRFLGQIIETHDTLLIKEVFRFNVYEIEGGPYDGEEVHTLIGSEGDAKIY